MKQLAQDVLERASRTPDAVAVVDGEGTHTVSEVLRQARELAYKPLQFASDSI